MTEFFGIGSGSRSRRNIDPLTIVDDPVSRRSILAASLSRSSSLDIFIAPATLGPGEGCDMVRRLGLFLIVFLGCSTEAPSPAEKCDDLADLLCERVSGCSDDGFTETECLALPAVTALSCPEASGVSSQYDECIDDLTVAPCSVLVAEDDTVEVPERCNAAILYRR